MVRFKLRTLVWAAAAACVSAISYGEELASDAVTEETPEIVEATTESATVDMTVDPSAQPIPNSVWDRIRAGFAIPNLDSAAVDRWTERYSKDPAYLLRMANRASQYLYNIVEEVEARNMPMELALLPFVESAFQPEALSRAKAAGLWQFMPATGKAYDLAQNLWRDDRRDVLESTRAALDYFEYLHGLFGDWQLTLAAYNWGEGSVQRAISRAKRRKQPTDYAHLRMPRETANYVPKLEAIKRIVSDPTKYGIELPDVVRVDLHVQGAVERGEPELGLELALVAVLADVVSALAHPRDHAAVDGYVVGELEDPAVLVVLLLQVVYALLGQLDALPAGPEVADDVLLVQKFQDPLGGGLLTHLESLPQLPGRYGDVVVHRP